MKRLPLLLVLFTLLLSACASNQAAATRPPAATETAIELTDGLGRTVRLENPAQRIVSLTPSNTEILFAVGAGEQVVGVDDFTNYPEQAQYLARIGGSMGDYNLEHIAALEPDLVLAAEINTPEQVAALEGLGLTVFYLANPDDLEGLYAMLNTAGRLTGHEEDAAALNDSLRRRVAAVLEKVEQVEERPSVFYELDGSEPSKPWTAGPDNFITMLIELAGGQNIAADLDQSWVQISQEELLVRDPDIILLGDATYGVTPESVAERAGWENLSAVKNSQVLPFNDDLVSRPGPRLVDALEQLAELLHPDLFN